MFSRGTWRSILIGCPLTTLMLITLGGLKASAPVDVNEFVKKLQKRYNKTKDFKGKFRQIYTDKLYERRRVSYGYVFVKKPGKMRWIYASPEKKVFISDGKTLWVVEGGQAFRNPLDRNSLSTGLTFLLGSGKLNDEFDVSVATKRDEAIGDKSTVVLKLVPKKKTPAYAYLLMAVDRENYVVTESMVVSEHSTNHLVLSHVEFNTGLNNSRFTFTPSKHQRVVGRPSKRQRMH